MANKLIPGVNDLETLYPEVAAQWDHEKNGELKPSMLLPGSGKRVWWKCICGNEWNTAVYHRTAGHKCGVCANREVMTHKGINDLATVKPELAAQFDKEKNAPFTASDFTLYSQAKVWWTCPEGHSWKTTVSHRALGEKCPYCAGNKILPGYNDIVTLGYVFVDEWDYEKNRDIRPEEVGQGTVRKVWWKCKKEGHSWEAAVYSRAAGSNCPYCAQNVVVVGVNDLETTHAEILDEWDSEKNEELKPHMVARTSAKPVWWKCPEGHSYDASPGFRDRGYGCPYCADRRVLKGFNDFESRHPELMDSWDREKNHISPDSITSGCSSEKVWWKDKLGHSWQATPANRVNGTDCPYCAGRQILKGFNDLQSVYPEVAAEWNHEKNKGLKPDMVVYGSHRKVWWRCGRGHEWRALVNDRAVEGTGCPYCHNKKVLPGFNDFASCHPELADEWHKTRNGGKKPSDYVYGSHKYAWWICPLGHDYQRTIADRHDGYGCPYCSNVKILAGFNDLATKTPWLAEEWDPERNRRRTPQEVFPSSNLKVWWRCEGGHHWRASISGRQSGSQCPYCHGLVPRKTHYVT